LDFDLDSDVEDSPPKKKDNKKVSKDKVRGKPKQKHEDKLKLKP